MSWQTYQRTTAGNTSGGPVFGAGGSTSPDLHHVVMTRTSAGAVRLYVDGVSVATGTRSGTLANWTNTYRLSVAAMVNGTEPWLGDLHLVAHDHLEDLVGVEGGQRHLGGADEVEVVGFELVDLVGVLAEESGAAGDEGAHGSLG